MLVVVLACSSTVDRQLRDRLEQAVTGADARLTSVSCGPGERNPALVGCLFQGSPDQIAKLLAFYGAAPGAPRTDVSQSPCVRHDRTLGLQLPGSDDWYPKDGVVTHHFAASHPSPAFGFGHAYALGDHVCVEVIDQR